MDWYHLVGILLAVILFLGAFCLALWAVPSAVKHAVWEVRDLVRLIRKR